MLFGILLMALAGVLGIMLFKGGVESTCCSCGQQKTENRQTSKTSP